MAQPMFPILMKMCVLFALLAGVVAAQTTAADPETTSVDSVEATGERDRATTESIDVAALLADPLARRPDLRQLTIRRQWLARQEGRIEAFEQVAEEFEKLGAHYAAVEMLWFAEKLTQDPAERSRLAERMRAILEEVQPLYREVDAAVQLWGSGKQTEALEKLYELTRLRPYNEKAYYQLGYLSFQAYLAQERSQLKLIDVEERAKVFRVCYERFMYTLAIDPLYSDAWYQLNLLRGVLPDHHEFIQKTQWMSERAATFQGSVLPAVGNLDGGERSFEAYVLAGGALEEVELFPMAIYLYQAALPLAPDEEARERLEDRMKPILKEKIPRG